MIKPNDQRILSELWKVTSVVSPERSGLSPLTIDRWLLPSLYVYSYTVGHLIVDVFSFLAGSGEAHLDYEGGVRFLPGADDFDPLALIFAYVRNVEESKMKILRYEQLQLENIGTNLWKGSHE